MDELKNQDEDPIAHFKAVAEKRNEERKTARNTSITMDLASKMSLTESNPKNVGYATNTQDAEVLNGRMAAYALA